MLLLIRTLDQLASGDHKITQRSTCGVSFPFRGGFTEPFTECHGISKHATCDAIYSVFNFAQFSQIDREISAALLTTKELWGSTCKKTNVCQKTHARLFVAHFKRCSLNSYDGPRKLKDLGVLHCFDKIDKNCDGKKSLKTLSLPPKIDEIHPQWNLSGGGCRYLRGIATLGRCHDIGKHSPTLRERTPRCKTH